MTATALPTASAQTSPPDLAPTPTELIAIGVGLFAMYAPTYMELNNTLWKIVGQGHGPVMLALTMWLIWQRLESFQSLKANPATISATVALIIGLVSYVVGRSQDVMLFDVGSQIFVISGIILLYKGWPGMKLMWFPIFFILFIIPIPGSIVDQVTAPLKSAVSYVSESLLFALGYPIGRSGVTLTIGPYQLLVADACAGLNSIFALEAIGVFYMSVVQHANKWRNILLASLILPISFISNVARVCILVLVTYYFGDAAGQGFVHDFAGILLFMLATALTIGTDSILGLFFKKSPQKTQP